MTLAEPRFVPDATLEREEMLALQRDIAAAASFADDLGFDPADVRLATDEGDGPQVPVQAESTNQHPVVVGVDQAFRDDEVVSAAVAYRGGEVIERVHAAVPVELPYIPGLLAFREAGGILAALDALETGPDCLLVDGSGRIHYRQAGLATHVGVCVNVPAVGVAKALLCGRPGSSLEDPLPVGERVPIRADEEVEAPAGTLLGFAVQTRQFEGGDRYVNPLYVSPGHRVGPETAVDLVMATVDGYKLPEPIRAADRLAGNVARGDTA